MSSRYCKKLIKSNVVVPTVTMAYLVYISITVVFSGERPVNYCKFGDR